MAIGECGVFANSLKRIGKWQMANAKTLWLFHSKPK